MSSTPINAVVFDLGKVLIDFEYQGLLDFIVAHGATFESIPSLLDRMQLFPYECGEISDEAFMAGMQEMLTDPFDEAELHRQWLEVFTPVQSMLDLAERLSRRYGVYILSNASAMHWRYLHDTFAIDRIGQGQLASFQAGVRKPDAAIYRIAEETFGLLPAQTVFIDDLAENAEGAIACGWHGIHHRGCPETSRALESLGVQTASPT